MSGGVHGILKHEAMNPTKNLIEPKPYTNPTKNLIELKLYMNPTKNLIEPKLHTSCPCCSLCFIHLTVSVVFFVLYI